MTRLLSPYRAVLGVLEQALDTGVFRTSAPPADLAQRLPAVWIQVPTGVPVANAASGHGQIWTVALIALAETNTAASELAWDAVDALEAAPEQGHLSAAHAAIASVDIEVLPFRPPRPDTAAQDVHQYNATATVRLAI